MGMAAPMPGVAAVPPINAEKGRVTVTANVSQDWCAAQTTASPSSLVPTIKRIAVPNLQLPQTVTEVPVHGVVARPTASVDTGRVTVTRIMNANPGSSAGRITAETFTAEQPLLLIAAFQAQGC